MIIYILVILVNETAAVRSISKGFVVPSGFLALVEDGRGNFLFYGEGVHLITDPFFKVKAEHQRISSSIMLHGDRALVTVEQGYIGYAVDKGSDDNYCIC